MSAALMMAVSLSCLGPVKAEASVGAELTPAEVQSAVRSTLDQVKATLPPAATTIYVPQPACPGRDSFTPTFNRELARSGYAVAADNGVKGAHFVRYELSAGDNLLMLRLQVDNAPAKARAFFRTPQGLVEAGGWTMEVSAR